MGIFAVSLEDDLFVEQQEHVAPIKSITQLPIAPILRILIFLFSPIFTFFYLYPGDS